MAQVSAPEFYLSLLSGRHSNVWDFSPRLRYSSGISHNPFPNDPNRLIMMDLLDALAAICIRKEKGEIFFVSLSIGPESSTLYVSSNETVSAHVVNHLCKIHDQLKVLNSAWEFGPSGNSSPSANETQSRIRMNGELELQKTMYEHSYSKLRQRFLKRAPAIIKVYPSVMESLENDGLTNSKDTPDLDLTYECLEVIWKLVQNTKVPSGEDLASLIHTIDSMVVSWQDRLNAEDDESILTQWDYMILATPDADKIKTLSLRRLLKKLFILHHHTRIIAHVAWSRRLSPFLKGKFNVVPVPATHGDITLKFSEQIVYPIIFPPGDWTKPDIKKTVYNSLLRRLQDEALSEGLLVKEGDLVELSVWDANVHAECTLLAYHVQHPDTNPFHYFGGSKISCHGCARFFSSFNNDDVASFFGHPRFFTKQFGCHNERKRKIHLRWPCPFLLSEEQRLECKDSHLSLDTRVRKGMVLILSTELGQYVEGLREIAMAPSRVTSGRTMQELWKAHFDKLPPE